MQVKGVVAIVTGAASGIGLGIATALARRGAKVILADIQADRAAEAAKALRDEGLAAASAALDVTEDDSWAALAALAPTLFGQPVQMLFNNAGVGLRGMVHTTPRRMWDWSFAVNVTGAFTGVATFAPGMLASGLPCKIVNTASEHALGLPQSERGGILAPYTAAKHALMGYSLCMRRDFAGSNVSAGVVCPGVVVSDIWNSLAHRQDRFGGPRQVPVDVAAAMIAAAEAKGIASEVAGERIADQVEDDSFFIFTNGPDETEVASDYAAEVLAALAAFKARYGI
jgi:NAD(P)-dependent dehydrogenase (short-subunit alcohol dehydrogenase family)